MKNIKFLVIIYFLAMIMFCIKPTYAKYVIKTETPMKVTISVDKKGPTVQAKDINSTSISNNGTATEKITISYSDNLSGIKSVTYKYNSSQKNFSNIQTKTLKNNTTFIDKGWYEITAIDNVGNKTVMYIYVDWAVARINQVYYRKLEYAINAVPANNTKTTIVMLRNVSEVNTIPNKKNILLDIDKKTITGSFTINAGGTLDVEDGTVNNTSQSATFTNNGTLRVKSGTYTSKNSKTIVVNSGTVNISGGIIQNTSSQNTIVQNGGIINISGGNIKNLGTGVILKIDGGTCNLSSGNYETNHYFFDIGSKGTLNLKGITIETERHIFTSAGIVNFSSGTLIGTNGNPIYLSGGTMTVSGGTIKMTDKGNSDLIALGSNATLKVTGGTIENASTNLPDSDVGWATISSSGKVVVSNNAIIRNTGNGRAIIAFGGNVTISGGSMMSKGANDEGGTVELWSGTLTMSGGTIESISPETWAVLTSGNSNISNGTIKNTSSGIGLCISGGTTKITGGTFSSASGNAIERRDGNVTISGAKINGRTSGI